MYRNELARVYELHDIAQNPSSPDAYFSDFDNKLMESPLRLKHFRDIETDLQGLDTAAWDFFKKQLAPLLTVKSDNRGWQALFDKLNEAKGYNHLVRAGCANVRFIPVSSVSGQRTPDLEGISARTRVLCEVKTVNISEDEAIRRTNGAAGSISLKLPDGFFKKLKSDIETATSQIVAYDPDNSVRRIIYVVLNFDDNLHEYAADYSAQIDMFLAAIPVSKTEIVFHIKPPFYSATV